MKPRALRRRQAGALVVLVAAAAIGSVPIGAGPVAGSPAPGPEPSRLAGVARDPGPLSDRLAVLAAGSAPGIEAAQSALGGRALPASGPGSLLRRGEQLLVEVRLDPAIPEAAEAVVGAGLEVVASDEAGLDLTIAAATDQLADLAAVPGVVRVREHLQPIVGGEVDPVRLAEAAAPATGPSTDGATAACPTGVVSEGDAVARADAAREQFGVDGAGVMVGILSDSYNVLGGAAQDVAQGELPGTGNPCGRFTPVGILAESPGATDGLDEGRALAQVVHDVAPGSSLRFATALEGPVGMANRIRQLASGGADVIVDDIGFIEEPIYQDSVVDDAISDVVDAGVSYFAAAGNSNLVVGGQRVGSFETDQYLPRDCTEGLWDWTMDCHSFDAPNGQNAITVAPGGGVFVRLGWNEPEQGIVTELDLALFERGTQQAVAWSAENNRAHGYASEWVSWFNDTGVTKVIDTQVLRAFGSTGAPRFKLDLVYAQGVQAIDWGDRAGDRIGANGWGHNLPTDGVAVGAVDFRDTEHLEEFSSFGPTRRCYPYNGYAPGTLPKPACTVSTVGLSAPDGVLTSFFPPFAGSGNRFYGTSAAAPHAAAVAALAREHRPACGPKAIAAAMQAAARPVGTTPTDGAGAGLIDAEHTLATMPACSTAPSSLRVEAPATALVGGDISIRITQLDAEGHLVAAPGSVSISLAGPTTTGPATVPLVDGVAEVVLVPGAVGMLEVSAAKVGAPDVDGSAGPIEVGSATRFHALDPVRVLDSRPGQETVGPYATRWGPGTRRSVPVVGGAVPDDAAAVVLNVTVTGTTAASFLSVWPEGAARPFASSLNWSAGVTIPNAITAKVGTGGKVVVYATAKTHVIFDVVGWYG